MGNLRSVEKAFEKIGADVIVSNNHEVIKSANKIVLPGVGAFKDGMKYLNELNLIELLNEEVIYKKKPFLGICLGMQLIGTKSYEVEETEGLNWIDAEVMRFDYKNEGFGLKIPHVGWNNVRVLEHNKFFKNVQEKSDFYFVHSYYLNINKEYQIGLTEYGFDFVSFIQKDNIYACQFHPEKSQNSGLQLIKNFMELKI